METKPLLFERYGSTTEENIYHNKNGKLAKKKKHLNQQYGLAAFKHLFIQAFLPQGYPESVSKDYLEYQLWDTLQAFCSSITGTLATHAMLKGYGVGDEKATAAAATITWMLKDGAGMVGRILFAWKKSMQLDWDAKRWRFYADILNDMAIFMELVAPIFQRCFLLIACMSSVLRSIVGVAGGATRAALTLHQAKRDNMADVSAKDGSQETLVNLLALLAGFIITPLVANNQILVWILFFLFTFLHLYANYCAVSAVVLDTVNKPRFYILMKHYFQTKSILTPDEVSKLDPVLRGPGYSKNVNIGVPLSKLSISLEELENYSNKRVNFLIYTNENKGEINISLNVNVTEREIRQSCFQAFYYLIQESNLAHCELEFDEKIFNKFDKLLEERGWNLSRCHLGVDECIVEWNTKQQ